LSAPLDLSLLSGCSLTRISFSPRSLLTMEFFGLMMPGSDAGSRSSSMHVISILCVGATVNEFRALLSGHELGEIDVTRSSLGHDVPDAKDPRPRYSLRLSFARGHIDFSCAEIHSRIDIAEEITALRGSV